MNKKTMLSTGLGLAIAVGVVAGISACVSGQKNAQNHSPSREVASIGDIFRQNMEDNSMIFSDRSAARRLTSEEVRKFSSSSPLKLQSGELLLDNDASFDAKLDAIKRAQKEIRMVYYIYSDDDSSSVFNREVIKKAQQGVKVKLLVDLITNYANMDLFAAMMKEGRGNIDIRFYNFPTDNIIAGAKYMTLPCPKVEKVEANTCQNYKADLMKSLSGQQTTVFSRMFLAGLYGKSATPLKIAMGMGAQINPADYKGKDGEEQDISQLFEFFKLVIEAKIKKDIGAMIKLQIAMSMYADKLNPVMNELTGRIPFVSDVATSGKKVSAAQEWDHFTDYTHHKLLAVDGREFQLGGRNIEDSYHMKSRLGTKGKYIFIDTDFHGVTANGGTAEIERSFDSMFNFKDMVTDFAKVQEVMPYDLVVNSQALAMASGSCLQDAQAGKVKAEAFAGCIEQRFTAVPAYVSASNRQAKVLTEMNQSSQNYLKNYAETPKKTLRDNWKMEKTYAPSSDDLSANDLKTSEVYYIENTAFDVDGQDKMRRVGARIGAEARFNKNIHALWYRGMENACRVSRDEKRDVRVIFHNAYLLMPSGMVHRIAKMLNGDYGDCSRVRLTFLTNSFQTTDLNVINVFARYQMIQLFKHYAGLEAYEKQFNENNKGITTYRRWFPKVDYFEYNAASVGAGISLHTKLSVLGDDMIIGSANADIRSYYMDTNNGVFIRNAHDLNRDYIRFIDSLIGDQSKTSEWTQKFAAYSDETVKMENKFILGAMIKRWDKKGRINEKKKQEILETLDRLGGRITNATYRLLNFRGDFESINFDEGRNASQLEMELNKIANDYDDFFKLL